MKKIKEYKAAARRVLTALENGDVPITWHEMHRARLELTIAIELARMDEEAKHEKKKRS